MPPTTRRLAAGPCTGAVLAALVLAGCGTAPEVSATTPTDDYLQVIVGSSDSTDVETFSLSCDGRAEGSHPDPQAACDHLHGMADPFAPLPTDVACTEQYGGPQTASVTGRWAGERVDVDLSRTDGCRIAQWDSLVPLVPAA
ncbi:SSI family serine proteinase inhibitor [Blastococcus sp. PRF04-17]|uniref:SSI family serine proteinase inhibitor n=1 Tax=Blastococcus sp. PRF04-17 TaxID=2933797 RepID=UPI001FF41F94|nr:SSI family serine proteinase inhibitor [Blastococcus sp. PRF04-17]UOY02737.1 subtilase-type protease inhibitor [Blastococcus sp. PRF04-17]